MADQSEANRIAFEAGDDVRRALKAALGATDGRNLWGDTIANFLGAVVAGSVAIVIALFGAMFRVAADLVAIFLTLMEEGRRQNFDAMNALIAAAMGDLFSIDINASDLPTGEGAHGQIDRVTKLGGAVHQVIIESLGGEYSGDPGPGERAARAFTGFGLSYAANAALTGIIPEIESLGFFKEFALIGEEIGKAMGFGRLHRRSMGPIVNSLIVRPLTQEMNAKYPHELLPLANLCTLFNAGLLDGDAFKQQMLAHGFDELQQARLAQAHSKPIPLALLETLVGSKVLTVGQAIATLQAEGYDSDTATALLQSAAVQRLDKLRGAVVSDAFAMAKDRHLSADEFGAVLSSANVAPDEVDLWNQRLALYTSHAHKRLSIGEIVYLIEHAQLTSADVNKWAIDSGYSDEDAFTLEMFVDLKDAEYQQKLKDAAARKAAAAAKAKAKQKP